MLRLRNEASLGWRAALVAVALAPGIAAAAPVAHGVTDVGLVVGDIGNPFFETLGRRVEEAVAQRFSGAARVTVWSSGYDLERQIAQIRQMVADGTQLLIVNAVDTEGIGPAIDLAKQAGVVVVAIDVEARGAQATVVSDNRGAGRMACEFLAKRLGGAGNVLIMNGPPTSSVTQRVEGCHEALSDFPDIEVLADDEDCGGSIEGGLSYMTAMLNELPQIDAVFAINDPTAIGADLAGAHAGRDDYFIVSIDGAPAAVDVIAGGDTRLVSTVSQNPKAMAEEAISFGERLFRGEPLKSTESITGIGLITRDNIADYPGW